MGGAEGGGGRGMGGSDTVAEVLNFSFTFQHHKKSFLWVKV